MNKNLLRLIVLLVVVGLVVAFFSLGLGQYLTLNYLKTEQQAFQGYYSSHQGITLAAFFLLYVTVTALSLPGATIMTLAAGALFGFGTGLIVVSFASTLGATGAFLVARFLLRDFVQNKFRDKLVAINAGIQREGKFYLFTLRVVPLFPFFIINMVMALTPIAAWEFAWVSQIGMLPGTAVYVNAGTQISHIDSLKGILSPQLILSFALLGIFPLLAKKIIGRFQKKAPNRFS